MGLQVLEYNQSNIFWFSKAKTRKIEIEYEEVDVKSRDVMIFSNFFLTNLKNVIY
jgi:hypothetical protein